MQFTIDKQTLEDLNLLGRYKPDSIFNIYNKTKTRGGSLLLEQMFREPFTNSRDITERSRIFSFFQTNNYQLPFGTSEFDDAEQYTENSDSPSLLTSIIRNLHRKALKLIAGHQELDHLVAGQKKCINLIHSLKKLCETIEEEAKEDDFKEEASKIVSLLKHKYLTPVYSYSEQPDTFFKYLKYDYYLRVKAASLLKSVINAIHKLDVYTTVARVSNQRNFSYAKICNDSQNILRIRGLYHPGIPKAVGNDLSFDSEHNVLFLTGANMAGKSTLMKSFGIAVYLTHMGFPAAFESMEITPAEGLFTSINVPDNLSLGYSHFYAEVVRVKMIAEEVAKGQRLIVMFDELFKGTNVKDAYDATVEITSAFSKKEKCSFVISTHIMEAGETLKKEHANITFKLLPSDIHNNIPRYTYKLRDGISDDRHGMTIIENEKILDIIEERLANNQ